jgi:hypothetical protein
MMENEWPPAWHRHFRKDDPLSIIFQS